MEILSLMVFGSLIFTGTAYAQNTTFSQEPFTDVPVNSSDFQAIEYLRSRNVIKGYMDGTFKPDTRINRAEFVEFVINPFILDTNGMGTCVKENISESATSVYFSDVSKDAWYAENVCFAQTKDIINGYPDGTFHPGDSINFVEAAKIISNVFSMNIEKYQIGEFWYRAYIQRLSDLHAIPTTIRGFDQTITRGEMSEIVYRLKMDETNKTSMQFDLGRNILYPRIVTVTPPVVAPKPPSVTRIIDRPSRRSIINEAEMINTAR